ncbi:MAG TPA: hypothetical protein VE999_03430 [Gemmataceae bacterium]|nr:hypothetical protein [Gemmataceae bacterium]
MTGSVSLASIITLCAALGGGSALADSKGPAMQGLWVMNAKESMWPAIMKGTGPGGAPFEHSMHVRDDGTALAITDVLKHSEDDTAISIWDGAWDGKEHKSSDGSAMAFQRVDATRFKDRWSNAKGDTGEDTCSFSERGMKLTCRGSTTPKGGTRASYVEVLDRIPSRLTVTAADGKEYTSMQGLWVENFEESNFGARGTPFKYHAQEVTMDDGKTLTFSDVIVRTDGKASKHTWSSSWEVPGNWPNGYVMTYQHLEHNLIRDHWVSPNGVNGGDTCSFSDGGRKMRCYGYNQPPGGKWNDLLEVSDRVD